MNISKADLFIFAIRRFSQSHGFNDEFQVMGYTTFINAWMHQRTQSNITQLNT